jgi:hypothetical protein
MKIITISTFTFFLMAGLVFADPVEDIVKMSQERGIVQKYDTHNIAPTMWVRPMFHEMDMEHKQAIVMAFLIHCQRLRPDANYNFIMIRDSRNNNKVGNYDERLGLSLKRNYR